MKTKLSRYDLERITSEAIQLYFPNSDAVNSWIISRMAATLRCEEFDIVGDIALKSVAKELTELVDWFDSIARVIYLPETTPSSGETIDISPMLDT